MDEQTRRDAADAYYKADSAFIGWNTVVGIAAGVILTAVGALIDIRSGVYGTLVLGIIILLAGVGYAIFGRRIRAMKRRQVDHLFGTGTDAS